MHVTIVIPTYNSAAFVQAAIDSALIQGELVQEIILVDNNSTDETLEVQKYNQIKQPELITICTAIKQGPSAARNVGWRKATRN
ncbi:MAG: glycosyltransferase [Bacteroidota bacterium]